MITFKCSVDGEDIEASALAEHMLKHVDETLAAAQVALAALPREYLAKLVASYCPHDGCGRKRGHARVDDCPIWNKTEGEALADAVAAVARLSGRKVEDVDAALALEKHEIEAALEAR